jgi:glycosyltransferase involved in cell wall biosynthesis
MKVLQLGKYYPPYMGGIESHLRQLCGELKSKVDLDVVVCNSEMRDVDDVVDGVHVHRCAELAKVASTSLCPTMPLALSKRDYDILHVHFPHPMGVMSYLASKKPRNHRIIVSYHSDIVKQKRLLQVYRPFMNLVLQHASAILCTSPNYLESSESLRAFRDKCVVVPLGIDLAELTVTLEIRARAAEIRTRIGAPLLLSVGRLAYYKGFEHAIRALREIPGAHLVIVGDGPLKGSLEACAHDEGVSERVHFEHGVSDAELVAFYAACDVFVLPSVARSEAFAIVQLEAMACSRPVVNTNLDSGVPFVSRHEESGLTVPPEDPHALAAAIRRILDDAHFRDELGARGRARVASEFTKEKMAASVLAVYEKALA